MGENSQISWTDHTYSPWYGCQKVSPACAHCFAEDLMARRFKRVTWGQVGAGAGTRARAAESTRRAPIAWNAKAARDGTHPLVFSLSLGDVFDNQIPVEWRVELFDMIEATPHLFYLLLTKRAQNVAKMIYAMRRAWPRNAALGGTIEDRKRLREQAPAMMAACYALNVPAMFASCEPLFEDIAEEAREFMRPWGHQGIGWWLTGGESRQGPGHVPRESDPAWFVNVRDACARQGALFHHKQMTDRRPIPIGLQFRARPDVERFCA